MADDPSKNPERRRHRREKATIDHLVDQMFDPGGKAKEPHPSTTDAGLPVEEQVRKEWEPNKDGGLPTF